MATIAYRYEQRGLFTHQRKSSNGQSMSTRLMNPGESFNKKHMLDYGNMTIS